MSLSPQVTFPNFPGSRDGCSGTGHPRLSPSCPIPPGTPAPSRVGSGVGWHKVTLSPRLSRGAPVPWHQSPRSQSPVPSPLGPAVFLALGCRPISGVSPGQREPRGASRARQGCWSSLGGGGWISPVKLPGRRLLKAGGGRLGGDSEGRGAACNPLKPLRQRGSSKDTAQRGCWGDLRVKGGVLPPWGTPGCAGRGGGSAGASVFHLQGGGSGIRSLGKLRHGSPTWRGGKSGALGRDPDFWGPVLVTPCVPPGGLSPRAGTARPPGAGAAPIAAVSAPGPVPGCISKALIPPARLAPPQKCTLSA